VTDAHPADRLAQRHDDRLDGLRDEYGRRPVYGENQRFQTDPHWRDLILFYEYFHGETGAGLGASHQTGWTGLVTILIDEWRRGHVPGNVRGEVAAEDGARAATND
jgi:hypothetical protein